MEGIIHWKQMDIYATLSLLKQLNSKISSCQKNPLTKILLKKHSRFNTSLSNSICGIFCRKSFWFIPYLKKKSIIFFRNWGMSQNNSCMNQQHAMDNLNLYLIQNIALIFNKEPWRLVWSIGWKPKYFMGAAAEIKNVDCWINLGNNNDHQQLVRPGI